MAKKKLPVNPLPWELKRRPLTEQLADISSRTAERLTDIYTLFDVRDEAVVAGNRFDLKTE